MTATVSKRRVRQILLPLEESQKVESIREALKSGMSPLYRVPVSIEIHLQITLYPSMLSLFGTEMYTMLQLRQHQSLSGSIGAPKISEQ